MAPRIKVGIKYCGHCNPQRQGPDIVRDLQKQSAEIEIVSWNSDSYDVLLVINACPVGCATRPTTSSPWIEVAVNLVRNWSVPTDHDANQILLSFKRLKYEFINLRNT